MAMAGYYLPFCVSRVGRFINYREAIAGAEMQKIFWRGAGSIPGARGELLPGQKDRLSRGRGKTVKRINQSDEKKNKRKN
jgi:hypothetical protein